MALRKPGSPSRIDLLTTGVWTVLMITVLIAGHVVLAYLIIGDGGMKKVVDFTGLPAWLLWLTIAGAIGLDGWVIYATRKERRKNLER
ncbi:MAG: hypothetical protein Q9M29_10115 [Mariprofundaceae bacterium]|nr:hypothetical protein [Mariprofundaceae bacterium]